MGRLIPAGTGMKWYRETTISTPEVIPSKAEPLALKVEAADDLEEVESPL